jgi:threonine/homoserine/homoserine lactone efflux protein
MPFLLRLGKVYVAAAQSFEKAVGTWYKVGTTERVRTTMSFAFLLTTLIIVITPGTGVLYTLAAGLSRGARASIIAAIGCTLGVIPPMLAAIAGLAAVLQASAAAFQTLKLIGVAYLLYMAWTMLRDRNTLSVEKDAAPRSALSVIVSAILLNLFNPKLTVFFFAFLPQFVSAKDSDASIRMLQLSSIFMLVTLVVFIGYGVFAASVRRHLLSRPRVMIWMRRTFAGAFVGLAARLALADR